eukprot:5757460-Prorocentrum_lima.AAC.1
MHYGVFTRPLTPGRGHIHSRTLLEIWLSGSWRPSGEGFHTPFASGLGGLRVSWIQIPLATS